MQHPSETYLSHEKNHANTLMLALETLSIIIPHSLQISKVEFFEIKKFRNICSVQVNGAMTHITETKACQGLRIGDPWLFVMLYSYVVEL